ncbi:14646_t:CDS:2, partial [Ambispora leptoticha]
MSHNGTSHQTTSSDTEYHSDSEHRSNSSISSPEYRELNETYSGDENNQNQKTSSSSVSALLQFPIVVDSLNYVKDSKYGGMAVNYAGVPIINTVSRITSPFQSQINQIDDIAANSIKSIGEKVPVIMKPTSEVIETVKTPAIQTIDTGKQYISNVTTPVYTIASNVGEEIDQRLAKPAKNLAQSMQAQITPIAKNVDNKFEPLVTKYARIVDAYLPEDESSDKEEESEDSFQLHQAVRAFNTTAKAHRRVSRSLKRTLTKSQIYTSEQLHQYTIFVKATETINQLQAKLHEVFLLTRETVQSPDFAVKINARLHEIVGWFVGELDKEKDLPRALKDRANDFSNTLITTRDSIALYIKENATHVPEEIQKRLKPLFEHVSEHVSEHFNFVAEHVSEHFNHVSEHVNQNYPGIAEKVKNLAEPVKAR